MKLIYLFYGFGGEYVLHELFLEFSRKFNCIEIDALKIKNSKTIINKLRSNKIVLVTSGHFLLNKSNFTDFYPNNNNFYSVLELISLLKPVKSVYIPHDLLFPLIANEKEYLNQFDLFLSPSEPFTTLFSPICNTIEVGWIKYHVKKDPIYAPNLAVWLLSDFILHIKMGKEKSFEANYPILKQGVSIKFPLWSESSEFTNYYRKRGVHVFEASNNSCDVINEHKIIFANGVSSINAESYLLGKTTINIMENSHYGTNDFKMIENNFPEIKFYKTIADVNLNKIEPTMLPNILKPFDMHRATAEIIV